MLRVAAARGRFERDGHVGKARGGCWDVERDSVTLTCTDITKTRQPIDATRVQPRLTLSISLHRVAAAHLGRIFRVVFSGIGRVSSCMGAGNGQSVPLHGYSSVRVRAAR